MHEAPAAVAMPPFSVRSSSCTNRPREMGYPLRVGSGYGPTDTKRQIVSTSLWLIGMAAWRDAKAADEAQLVATDRARLDCPFLLHPPVDERREERRQHRRDDDRCRDLDRRRRRDRGIEI